MKLSILVPTTEGRAAFWPWLIWNIEKQTGIDWSQVEVLVAAGPEFDCRRLGFAKPALVRNATVQHSVPLFEKRNALLREARGEVVAWFDDDDWHHPDRLGTQLRHAERGIATFVRERHFLGLFTGHGLTLWNTQREIIPITFVGPRSIAVDVPFEPRPLVRVTGQQLDYAIGEDSRWAATLLARSHDSSGPKIGKLHLDVPHFVGLIHDRNTCQAIYSRWPLNLPPGHFAQLIGSAAWQDTDRRLADLQARLVGAT